MATAAGPCEPLTCRTDPPPIAAMAFITPGSKLLPTATAWNVPGLPSASRRSRLAKATGSASPVVTMPSPI